MPPSDNAPLVPSQSADLPAANDGKGRASDDRCDPPPSQEVPGLAHRSESNSPRPTSALLLGRDHTELGDIATRAVTSNLAIGIARGRFPKGYPHIDLNEDAVFATTDGRTTILAVADAHNGFDAAVIAISAIAEAVASTMASAPRDIVRLLVDAAGRGVASTIPDLGAPRNKSRTALSIAAIRDRRIAATTIGDTACYIATRRRARRIGTDTDYLGPNTDLSAIQIEETSPTVPSSVVVASDGLADFAVNARRTLRAATKLPALDGVEHLIRAAFSGGAGDNVAIAASWPGSHR